MRARWILPLLWLCLRPAAAQSNSFTIPAWAFDRGNVRTFTEEYADVGPMVAYGGHSPIFVEYDLEFPAAGSCTLSLAYAAGAARPVELLVDGQSLGPVCRSATGSWNTGGAQWEESSRFQVTAGRHTIALRRADDFPHVVSLRFEGLAIPPGFTPNRPRARRPPAPARTPSNQPFVHEVKVVALRLAIEDLVAGFGPRYANGRQYLKRLEALETALNDPGTAAQARSNLIVLQREALLANPLLDCDKLLVLKREFTNPSAARHAMGHALGVGSLNAHTSDDIPRQGHWNDELAVLSNLRGEPQSTTLYRPDTNETLIDPVLHFDADRLLFAKNGDREKNWRLFELDLRSVQGRTARNHASPSPLNGESLEALNRTRNADFSPQDRGDVGRHRKLQTRGLVPGPCGLKSACRFMEWVGVRG